MRSRRRFSSVRRSEGTPWMNALLKSKWLDFRNSMVWGYAQTHDEGDTRIATASLMLLCAYGLMYMLKIVASYLPLNRCRQREPRFLVVVFEARESELRFTPQLRSNLKREEGLHTTHQTCASKHTIVSPCSSAFQTTRESGQEMARYQRRRICGRTSSPVPRTPYRTPRRRSRR